MTSRANPLPRCAAVWAGTTMTAVVLVAWLLPGVQAAANAVGSGHLAAGQFEDLLVWLCSTAALLATCWLWTVTTLVTLDAARGRTRAGVPGVPDAVRRVVLAACGVALAGGVATPALATPGEVHHDHTATPTALLSGLPMPDRASGGVAPTHGRSVAATVRVRAGDTLWHLAALDLPPGAGDEQVSAHWQAIYALNRAVIGADPDLIHPDQQLRLPRD